jgi:hypothetical protein
MIECNFYCPEDVKPLYDEIVPVYQAAFAGEPWYEVSKCADKLQRCVGGLSSLAIGEVCDTCNSCPLQPAYEKGELVSRFEGIAATRPTAWYTERNSDGLTLAAIAWEADAETIATEKYADVPAMDGWLRQQLGNEPIVWLDEVFANRSLQVSGNLRRFGNMCSGLTERLQNDTLAFRTINERMTAATIRDFPGSSTVFVREADVPDRREFVTIRSK